MSPSAQQPRPRSARARTSPVPAAQCTGASSRSRSYTAYGSPAVAAVEGVVLDGGHPSCRPVVGSRWRLPAPAAASAIGRCGPSRSRVSLPGASSLGPKTALVRCPSCCDRVAPRRPGQVRPGAPGAVEEEQEVVAQRAAAPSTSRRPARSGAGRRRPRSASTCSQPGYGALPGRSQHRAERRDADGAVELVRVEVRRRRVRWCSGTSPTSSTCGRKPWLAAVLMKIWRGDEVRRRSARG